MSGKLIEIKNKKPLEITMKGDTTAEILLYAQIGQSFWEEGITATSFAEQLKALPKATKEIHLRVNSPGGSVFDGMTIYELLRKEAKNGRKITAYVDGIAASIASIIIMAADEVVVGDGSMVMIHKPMGGVFGNSMELERTINILDKIEEQMISIYAKKTGQSRSEISKALAEETWYTSEEAVDIGLADSKFKAENTLQLVASSANTNLFKSYRNKPELQNKNDLVRAKLREFNNNAKDFLNKK